jgi:hypothetical protein
MAERWDDQEFNEISRLIREEEDRALEIFRQRNFDQKIRVRIAAVPKRKRGFFGHGMAIPATIAALILIAGGTVVMVTRRPSSSPESGSGPIAAILKDLPGITDFVMPKETIPAGPTDAFGPARTFRVVLAMVKQQNREEERNATVPTGSLRVPHLSLEKKMEILFKDRAIERVLVRMFRKSEEV